MNIKKSVKLALIESDKRQTWLAGEMGLTDSALSSLLVTNRPNAGAIEKMAKAFNMKVSEFVALGE